MANVTAKLRCLDHCGETVNTRWGDVEFDEEGLAELEVPEEDLPLLQAIKPYSWLVDDQPSFKAAESAEADKPAQEGKPQKRGRSERR